MCNVNKATRSIEIGKKKGKRKYFQNLSREKRGKIKKGRRKTQKKYFIVVNRKGMYEGETLDRFIGVGLHKKSVLCAV